MPAEAMLNVRLPRDLKERGDKVLSREGISVSHAIRSFYRQVDELQDIPPWLRQGEGEDIYEARRRGIRRLVGIIDLPDDFDMDDLKAERLSRIEF